METILDFNIELQQQMAELAVKKVMVFATCAGGRVTARNMSVIVFQNKVYFQTDIRMEKVQQIQQNPNVALCVDSFQIEGQARIAGPWGENSEVLEEYLKVHKNSYLRYENLQTEVLVEVTPTRIKKWEYIDNQPFVYELNLVKRTAVRQEYECE